MNPTLIKFGNNLKNLRQTQNLSTEKMAELCNLSHQEILEFEAGEVDVPFLMLIKIAECLNIPVGRLMDF